MKDKTKMLIADVLFWGSIIMVFLWTMLKLFGIINTAIWLELLPQWGVLITVIAFAYKFGSDLGGMKKDVHYLKRDFEKHMDKHHT